MAQMAAQDYFSRLQMSGMMHPDLANLSALGNLASFSNANNSLNSSSSSGSNSKNNLKRKDKMPDSYDMKKTSKDSMHQSKGSNYNQSYASTSNLQKDFMAMAAAAAQLNTSHDGSLNDSKGSSKSMQNNYNVPSRNSNVNSPLRANSNSSSARKKEAEKKYDHSGKHAHEISFFECPFIRL